MFVFCGTGEGDREGVGRRENSGNSEGVGRIQLLFY